MFTKLNKILVFILSLVLTSYSNSWCQTIVLDSSKNKISLEDLGFFIKCESDSINLSDLKKMTWSNLENSGNFGVVKDFYWIKYEVENNYSNSIPFNFYIPYHHIKKAQLFLIHDSDSTLLNSFGTSFSYKKKELNIPGYSTKIMFKPGLSQLVLHIDHYNMPLRTMSHLVSDYTLKVTQLENQKNNTIWYSIIFIALGISFVLFITTRIKHFLLYFFLNIGVFTFISIETGGFFTIFDIDSYQILFDLKHLGIIIVLFIFPLFLNELTPIKKLNPKIWKIMNFLITIALAFWIIGLNNNVKNTYFFYLNVWYLIVLTILIFFGQLFLLLISYRNKENNSLILLIVYSIYIIVVTYEVVLPNIGLKSDSFYVYRVLLKTSLIEIFLFFFLMGREMARVYEDRNKLLEHQKKLQEVTLNAIIEGQEVERNNIGRELHDMIGANLAVIKQNVNKKNENLIKIIDKTIYSIRSLSHGLLTPKVEGNQLKNEIIDLCLLTSNKKLDVNYYFHNWKALQSKVKSTHLYRIFQELLQNTIKHSDSDIVYVQIIRDNKNIIFSYEDNGKGFNFEQEKGKGILGIIHRADLLKADMVFDSTKKGTNVTIEFKDENI